MSKFQNQYDYEVNESNIQVINRFKLFFLKPIFIGLFTFAIFFTTILITKILTYLLSEHVLFSLNMYDVLFALIGFGVGFIFEFALNIRKILSK